MIHITRQLDGGRLEEWEYEGFADEAVLVVPMNGMLYEVGVRALETPSHTHPTAAARAASLDEIAELAVLLAEVVEVNLTERPDGPDLGDRTKGKKP